MGKLSKNKGANFEREVVNILKSYDLKATRTAPLQAGLGSGGAADIYCPNIGYIEAKRRANGLSFVYEALADADLLVFRADRKQPLAIMNFDALLEIITSKREGSK